MTMNVTASFGQFRQLVVEPAPVQAPKPNRPDEFWWVEWCEGMPLEPARISFRGDTPHGILEIGSDYEQDLSEREVRLVEPVVPAGLLAKVLPILEDVSSQQTAPGPDQQLFEVIEMLRGEPGKA